MGGGLGVPAFIFDSTFFLYANFVSLLKVFWTPLFCPVLLSQVFLVVTLLANSHFLLSTRPLGMYWVPTMYQRSKFLTRALHFALGLCLASLEVSLQAAKLPLEDSNRSRIFCLGTEN